MLDRLNNSDIAILTFPFRQLKNDKLNIFGDEIEIVNIGNEKNIDSSFLKHWFSEKYISDLKVDTRISEMKISGPGFEVYSISIQTPVPNSFKRAYTIVHAKRQDGIYLVPIKFGRFF